MEQQPQNSPLDLLSSAGRILVVEPDGAAFEVIEQGLQAVSHTVVYAPSAQEAWQNLRWDVVDCVLSELNLPDMHGLQLLERVRQSRETNLTPFLMLTGNRQPSMRIRALQMGADDYIVKPCVLGELQAKIGTIMRRARMMEARGSVETFRGVSGALDAVSSQELLQFLESTRKTGLLQVTTTRAVIKVGLQDGQIVNASFADIEGEEAVFLLFACTEGRFTFRPDVTPTGERNVNRSLQMLLLEGLRMMDETVRVLNEREAKAAQPPPEDDPNASRIVQSPASGTQRLRRTKDAVPAPKTPMNVRTVRATPTPPPPGAPRQGGKPAGVRDSNQNSKSRRTTTRRMPLRQQGEGE